MDLPKGFEDAFCTSTAGRRFLLNILTGHERGDFAIISDVRVFLVKWFETLSATFPILQTSDVPQALIMFDALASKYFTSYACPENIYDSRSDLEELSRVIDVDALALDPAYSLIEPSLIDEKKISTGTGIKHRYNLQ